MMLAPAPQTAAQPQPTQTAAATQTGSTMNGSMVKGAAGVVAEGSDGLIALSGAHHGELGQSLVVDNFKQAQRLAVRFRHQVGDDGHLRDVEGLLADHRLAVDSLRGERAHPRVAHAPADDDPHAHAAALGDGHLLDRALEHLHVGVERVRGVRLDLLRPISTAAPFTITSGSSGRML